MISLENLTSENKLKLQSLEVSLGYKFADVSLLQKALIHSSFGFEQLQEGQNNETLEFLGDAVLELAVSDMLFHMYPDAREGELTKLRAGLVREATLAGIAMDLQLGDFLMLGKGEEASRGREKSSILASGLEALIGAMYLDRGYEKVQDFVGQHFAGLLPKKKKAIPVDDAKSLLQEKLQAQFNQAPTYQVDSEEGPPHSKRFTVSVWFMEEVLGQGSGTSKKMAEQQAAESALAAMDSWWGRFMKMSGSGNRLD